MDISFEILPNDRKYYGTRILATAPNGDQFEFSVWPPYSFGADKTASSVAISPREDPESFDASHGETLAAYRVARLITAAPRMFDILRRSFFYMDELDHDELSEIIDYVAGEE